MLLSWVRVGLKIEARPDGVSFMPCQCFTSSWKMKRWWFEVMVASPSALIISRGLVCLRSRGAGRDRRCCLSLMCLRFCRGWRSLM